MSGYWLDFQNKTNRAWTFGLYLTFPNLADLDSVAWGLMTVEARHVGYSGIDLPGLSLYLASYSRDRGRGVYRVTAGMNAGPGTWEIPSAPVHDRFVQIGPAHRPELIIRNVSQQVATVGIGLTSHPAVYKKSLEAGASLLVKNLIPAIYVGLFNEVERGEVISGNVTVGPLLLQFPSGQKVATLTASLQGSETVLSVIYSREPGPRSVSMPLPPE